MAKILVEAPEGFRRVCEADRRSARAVALRVLQAYTESSEIRSAVHRWQDARVEKALREKAGAQP